MILNITVFFLLVALFLVIIRAVKGPTFYDRMLSTNMFGTVSMLILLLIGYLSKRPEFADIALVYAMISFVGTIVILKFVRYRNMSIAMKVDKLTKEKDTK